MFSNIFISEKEPFFLVFKQIFYLVKFQVNFKELGIKTENIYALKKNSIITPTPVQEKVIPLVLEGRNVMVQSKTGSGKTLAFIFQ